MVNRNKNIEMKKIIIIITTIVSTLLCGWIFLHWIAKKWNDSDPRLVDKQLKQNYKSIIYNFKLDSTNYKVVTNFVYSEEELSKYQQSKIDSMEVFNFKIDSILIGPSPYELSIKKLPILVYDSIPFPNSFYIKIFNENMSKLYKELDYHSFIQFAKTNEMHNNNPLTTSEWTLVIDSTLLDLKK